MKSSIFVRRVTPTSKRLYQVGIERRTTNSFQVWLWQISEIWFLLTDSLWRRQSQQSFNTLTPFNIPFYSLHVSAPTGHPHVRYTISYFLFLKDYFNTTDQLHVCNFIIGMLFVVIGFSTYSPNTCYHIKYKQNCKISKIPRWFLLSDEPVQQFGKLHIS
jgi:hypothetical protein